MSAAKRPTPNPTPAPRRTLSPGQRNLSLLPLATVPQAVDAVAMLVALHRDALPRSGVRTTSGATLLLVLLLPQLRPPLPLPLLLVLLLLLQLLLLLLRVVVVLLLLLQQ